MTTVATIVRYINLLTDYAFKLIFGHEANKDLLIDFINTVLDGEHRIVDLQFCNSERLGITTEDRKVVFDLLCENDRGEKILVELQQARETYFKDRALFYAASLIQEQGVRGKWDYKHKATYVISILNFEIKQGPNCIHRVSLRDQQSREAWSNSLHMIFLEVPKGPKDLDQCQSHFDRWLYLLGNLHRLTDKPKDVQEAVFQRLFDLCEIGKFPEAERVRYMESLSTEERMEEALKYAKMAAEEEGLAKGLERGLSQGLAKGRAEGDNMRKLEIVRRMLEKGCEWSFITEITGVKQEDWESQK